MGCKGSEVQILSVRPFFSAAFGLLFHVYLVPGMKKEIKRNSLIPDWAIDPLDDFNKDLRRLDHVLRLSRVGIITVTGIPDIAKALAALETYTYQEKGKSLGDDNEAFIARAQKEAILAQHEVDEGFPIINALGVVAVWSSLEEVIKSYLTAILKNSKPAWNAEHIQKLQIKISDFHAMSLLQRSEYVIEVLEKDRAVRKVGVDRFEALLEVFDYAGEVPEPIKETIYELSQVRNLIAHRSSKIDVRFKKACPWVRGRLGSRLHVTAPMLDRYISAVSNYITLFACRIGERYGLDMRSTRTGLEKRVLDLSTKLKARKARSQKK